MIFKEDDLFEDVLYAVIGQEVVLIDSRDVIDATDTTEMVAAVYI